MPMRFCRRLLGREREALFEECDESRVERRPVISSEPHFSEPVALKCRGSLKAVAIERRSIHQSFCELEIHVFESAHVQTHCPGSAPCLGWSEVHILLHPGFSKDLIEH